MKKKISSFNTTKILELQRKEHTKPSRTSLIGLANIGHEQSYILKKGI